MLKRVFLLLSFFVFISSAQAGILLEPFVGMGTLGSWSPTTATAPGIYREDTITSMNYGARLGLTYARFILGAHYGLGTTTFKTETTGITTSTGETEYQKSSLGIYVGFKLPILLKIYGIYYLEDQLDDETETDNSKVRILKGSGMSFGLAYTAFPLLNINAEYRLFTYDEGETAGGEEGPLTTNQKVNDVFISLSFPFSI